MWYKLDGDSIVKIKAEELPIVEKSRRDRRLNTNVSIKNPHITVAVSTVFLSVDHSFRDGDAPVLFETMVFVKSDIELDPDEYLAQDEIQIRYETIQGARKGHKRIVEHITNELTKKELGRVKVDNIKLSL